MAHNGHCHCDDGYLFDGATCVGPSEIVQTCEEHEAPDGGDDDGGDTHVHGAACRCPTTGTCPCEHGEVQVLAGSTYCVPHLDE
ncbi:MAG: hypothetical protein MUF54_21925 [Polyangiaceae bacterium]|nr:hypothetical protein [Polyangiaceae bacterium]